MKQLFWILATVLCMSCNAHKKNTSRQGGIEHVFPPYKSEFYFDNCNDAINFLKAIIVNKQEDNSLKKVGYFKIPHINAAYANAKDAIPPPCFVGMSIVELESIFGLGSSEGPNTSWYFLQYHTDLMSIQVQHRNGVVEKFIIHKSTVQVGPGK